MATNHKGFPNADVLGLFTAPNHLLSPFDARSIVLVHSSWRTPRAKHTISAEVDEQFRFRLPGAGKSNVFAGKSEGLSDRLLRLIKMAGVDVEHGCIHL